MRLLAIALVACALGACGRSTESNSAQAQDAAGEVVLYSSVDDYALREVVAAFEAETGIAVRVAGDTEATKTTGLVTRLLAEKDAPKADVWWSSEPFGTIRLAEEGVLDPATEQCLPESVEWPAHLRSEGGAWIGMAQRARVIVYSLDRAPDPPTTLAELASPEWKGRVGMARPQFGTTRGHMAALVERWGPGAFESWVTAMKRNDVRLYDGNATVVRKVAEGEIDVGLTDTDDVYVAWRNGWDVEMVFETLDPAAGPEGEWASFGAMVIPNTVSIVKGAPNQDNARALATYLLSGAAERVLADSDSRNVPVHPGVTPNEETAIPVHPGELDLHAVARRVPEAMDICERVLDAP